MSKTPIRIRMPRVFGCNPQDAAQLPYVDGCNTCAEYRSDMHPGLFTWLCTVAEHFDSAHEILITGAGAGKPAGWIVDE